MSGQTAALLTPQLEQAFARCQGYAREQEAVGKPAPVEFEPHEVHVPLQQLRALAEAFYLDVPYDSKSHHMFAIAQNPGVPPAWAQAAAQPAVRIPDDLFSDIIGHAELKELIVGSMQKRRRVHFLLWGPPAGAKSMFLDAIYGLPNTVWFEGGSTTRAGIVKELAGADPDAICFDEADDVKWEVWSPLVEMMERGTMTVRDANISMQVRREGQVFIAGNSRERLERNANKVISRCSEHYIGAYTKAEFVHVAETVLARREEVDSLLAREMAYWAWAKGLRDIRKVRTMARLCDTLDAAKRYLDSQYRYREDVPQVRRRR